MWETGILARHQISTSRRDHLAIAFHANAVVTNGRSTPLIVEMSWSQGHLLKDTSYAIFENNFGHTGPILKFWDLHHKRISGFWSRLFHENWDNQLFWILEQYLNICLDKLVEFCHSDIYITYRASYHNSFKKIETIGYFELFLNNIWKHFLSDWSNFDILRCLS